MVLRERTLLALLATAVLATIVHFGDNAFSLDEYPGPDWITPVGIVVAWLAITTIGVVGYIWYRRGWQTVAAVTIYVYGLLVMAGCLHYVYAAPAELTLKANVLIVFEVVTGAALMIYTTWMVMKPLPKLPKKPKPQADGASGPPETTGLRGSVESVHEEAD